MKYRVKGTIVPPRGTPGANGAYMVDLEVDGEGAPRTIAATLGDPVALGARVRSDDTAPGGMTPNEKKEMKNAIVRCAQAALGQSMEYVFGELAVNAQMVDYKSLLIRVGPPGQRVDFVLSIKEMM